MKLLVTDAQVHTVGLFFIEGMVGLIKCLRSEGGTPLSQSAQGESLQVFLQREASAHVLVLVYKGSRLVIDISNLEGQAKQLMCHARKFKRNTELGCSAVRSQVES